MKNYQFVAFVALLSLFAQSGSYAGGSDNNIHSATDADKKDVAQSVVPAFVDYTPFQRERYGSVSRQEVADGLHKAIREGLDKAQTTGVYNTNARLTSPDDIQALRALLKAPQNITHTRSFADTRLLFDADRGETQIFVDQGGLVSQGTRLWQLSPQDFAQLRQLLKRIYATVLGQR